MERERRKLAAILAVDAVGYSRLMGKDEVGTLARLKAHHAARFEPALARNGGRLVKLIGDGALAEFGSAVDAVRAAIEFQSAMVEFNRSEAEDARIVFRVGLHLGDLIVDGHDLYGDGVNVAARLEAEAPPNGIILSGDIHNAVAGKLKASLHDVGLLPLKNIDRPVQAFRVEWNPVDWQVPAVLPPFGAPAQHHGPLTEMRTLREDLSTQVAAHPPHGSISIAVLPFMAPEHILGHGFSEDLIVEMSRLRDFSVISLQSSQQFPPTASTAADSAHQLGARYILAGTLRRSGERLRVTAQLIDGNDSRCLWAERYERVMTDLFDVVDDIVGNIIGCVEAELGEVERQRASRANPTDLDAWELAHRGMWHVYRFTREDTASAEQWLHEAIERAPDFSLPYAGLAYASFVKAIWRFADDLPAAMLEGLGRAEKAIAVDPHSVLGHVVLGRLLTLLGDLPRAFHHLERAMEISPSFAQAHFGLGQAHLWSGQPERALRCLVSARRLSPKDPLLSMFLTFESFCHFALQDHSAAEHAARRAAELRPAEVWAQLALAVAMISTGRMREAREAMDAVKRIDGNFSIALLEPVVRHVSSDRRVQLMNALSAIA